MQFTSKPCIDTQVNTANLARTLLNLHGIVLQGILTNIMA